MTRSFSRARRGLLTAGVSAEALRACRTHGMKSLREILCERECTRTHEGKRAGLRYLRVSSKRSAAIGATPNGHCCARPVLCARVSPRHRQQPVGSEKRREGASGVYLRRSRTATGVPAETRTATHFPPAPRRPLAHGAAKARSPCAPSLTCALCTSPASAGRRLSAAAGGANAAGVAGGAGAEEAAGAGSDGTVPASSTTSSSIISGVNRPSPVLSLFLCFPFLPFRSLSSVPFSVLFRGGFALFVRSPNTPLPYVFGQQLPSASSLDTRPSRRSHGSSARHPPVLQGSPTTTERIVARHADIAPFTRVLSSPPSSSSRQLKQQQLPSASSLDTRSSRRSHGSPARHPPVPQGSPTTTERIVARHADIAPLKLTSIRCLSAITLWPSWSNNSGVLALPTANEAPDPPRRAIGSFLALR